MMQSRSRHVFMYRKPNPRIFGVWVLESKCGESMWFQELDVLSLLGLLIVLSALSVCLLVGKLE
jgi:hypothetical protein